MKQLLDKLFPTLSDELIIVITLIICLLVTASTALFLVKKLSPKTNISELVARTRSWWIMAAMFIGAVFISYDISYFFLAFSITNSLIKVMIQSRRFYLVSLLLCGNVLL